VKRFVALLGAVAVLATGCSSGSPASSSTGSPSTGGPSVSALMVCSTEAQSDVEDAIGVGLSAPPASDFTDGVFTCDYAYPTGTMVLTVKDLPDQASTLAYVNAGLANFKTVRSLPGLGDAAYSDDTSTVFVRKDNKVLRVDTSGLPTTFGQPPHTRSVIAIAVAAAIILCWTGA
jgi:hypothetical protein